MCYHDGAKKDVVYLNLTVIRQAAINPMLNENHPLMAGRKKNTQKQRHKTVVENDRNDVSAYIGRRMFECEHKKCINSPYNFDNHWIAFHIYSKLGRVVVLDSADRDPKTYKDFCDFLDCAYRFYLKLGGQGNRKLKTNMAYKTHFKCLKQVPGNMHCGFYVCNILTGKGHYTIFSTDEPPIWKDPDNYPKKHNTHMSSDELYLIGSKLLRFIMREFIHRDGAYHDPESLLVAQHSDLCNYIDKGRPKDIIKANDKAEKERLHATDREWSRLNEE